MPRVVIKHDQHNAMQQFDSVVSQVRERLQDGANQWTCAIEDDGAGLTVAVNVEPRPRPVVLDVDPLDVVPAGTEAEAEHEHGGEG